MASVPSKESQQWHRFFAACLQHNLNLKSFTQALNKQSSKCPSTGVRVLGAWAGNQSRGFVIRPRYMKYFETLLHSHLVTDEDAILFVLQNFRATIASQNESMILSEGASEDYKPTVEAAVLERLAYQMVNFRIATVPFGDRTPTIRILNPLMALLSAFNENFDGSAPLGGPALEIALELGRFVAAYLNDLSLLGLLTCDNGSPPKGMEGQKEIWHKCSSGTSFPKAIRALFASIHSPSRPNQRRALRVFESASKTVFSFHSTDFRVHR